MKIEPVAIIGIGCKYPGDVSTLDEFWQLISQGHDFLTPVPGDRWSQHLSSKEQKLKNTIGGFISGIDQFDNEFFGISPKESSQIDPQQRLILQISMEALEDAKISLNQIKGTNTGVFIGSSSTDYQRNMEIGDINQFSTVGSNPSFLSNRLSYFLDITGPSMTINTACSSSLVALHLAANSIWNDECRMAIVGGVNLIASPQQSIDYGEAGLTSQQPQGRCFAFDARADGYVRSEGAGILILKNLSDALKDKDEIYSIILNTSTNTNGKTPRGIAAPRSSHQEQLIEQLLSPLGTNANDIGYFECHGTGTQMGDLNELTAIGNSLGKLRDNPLPIGSTKANLGHLEGGSGICSVIKTIGCLKNRSIPPMCPQSYATPNPNIPFKQLNLYIPTGSTTIPWIEKTRLAIVNSFGVGGSNCNVLLSSFDQLDQNTININNTNTMSTVDQKMIDVFTISVNRNRSQGEEQLKQRIKDVYEYIQSNPKVDIKDICYTSTVRTNHLSNRVSFVVDSRDNLLDQLTGFLSDNFDTNTIRSNNMTGTGEMMEFTKKKLGFVFSGQGQQWITMGKELFDVSNTFRTEFIRCSSMFQAISGWSLVDKLFDTKNKEEIHGTWLAQPSIFAFQASLTVLLRECGIIPSAVIGHSLGEVSAAYASGMLTLEDAVKLIWLRSTLQNKTSGSGKMCVAMANAQTIQHLITKHGYAKNISVAGDNSPKSVGVAGDHESMNSFLSILESANISYKLIRINAGFHCHLMDSIKEEFYRLFPKNFQYGQSMIPMYSTTTATLITDPSQLNVDYWWNNIRETVLFRTAFELVRANEELDGFLEISAHPIIALNVSQCLRGSDNGSHDDHFILPTVNRDAPSMETLLVTLSKLYVGGYDIDWSGIYPMARQGGLCKAIKLPHRRWNMDHFWVENYQLKNDRLDVPRYPSLTRRIVSLLPCFETRLNSPRFKYLLDHSIQSLSILPYSFYLEIVYSSMYELLEKENNKDDHRHFTINQMEIKNALVLDSKLSNTIQIQYNSDCTSFEIGSLQSNVQVPQQWVVHAVGQIQYIQQQQQSSAAKRVGFNSVSLSSSTTQNMVVLNGNEFYEKIAKHGYHYGQNFQAVKKTTLLDQDTQISEIKLPQTGDCKMHCPSHFRLAHPSLLDACLQGTFAPFELDHQSHSRGLWIPQNLGKLEHFQNDHHSFAFDDSLYSYSKIISRNDQSKIITTSITLCDSNQNTLLEISDLVLKCIQFTNPPLQQQQHSSSTSQKQSTSFWGYEWNESDEGEIRDTNNNNNNIPTVIFTNDKSSFYTQHLIELFGNNRRGQSSNIYVVVSDETSTINHQDLEAIDEQDQNESNDNAIEVEIVNNGITVIQLKNTVDPNHSMEQFQELFSILSENHRSMSSVTWRFILLADSFVESQSQTNVTPMPTSVAPIMIDSVLDVERNYANLLSLIQNIMKQEIRGKLWMVTKGGQHVNPIDTVNLCQYSLVGMMRTVSNEYPHLQVSMIDMDSNPWSDESNISQLVKELHRENSHWEVAFRNGKRFTYHLVPIQTQLESYQSNETFSSSPRYEAIVGQGGIIGTLKLVEKPNQMPTQPNHVKVKVTNSSLNFRDILKNLGRDYDVDQLATMGDEFSGTIVQVGPGIDQEKSFKVGDRVFGIHMSRSMTNYVCCPADLVFKTPDQWTDEMACTIPLVFLTAWYSLLSQARLERGESILIHSACGGVGLAALQIAKHIGADIYVTVGTNDKRQFLQNAPYSIPAHKIFDSRSLSFKEALMNATGGNGVNVVLNSLSGDFVGHSLQCVAPYGRFVEIGKKDIYSDSKLGLYPFRNNLSYLAVDIMQMTLNKRSTLSQLMENSMLPLFNQSILESLPLTVFGVSRLVPSIRHMSAGTHIGKIIVQWSQDQLDAAKNNDLTVQMNHRVRSEGGTHLIAGFGVLAQSTARVLARLGASTIVFVSRSGMDNNSSGDRQSIVSELVGQGVDVHVKKCNLEDPMKVDELIQYGMVSLPPVCGVFLATGVLNDKLIYNQSSDSIKPPLRSKACVAINLANATSSMTLDYFITISSCTTILGNLGQSNYATANRFVEGLSHRLRQRGVHATCIHLSPIPSSAGMAANHMVLSNLNNMGFTPFTSVQQLESGLVNCFQHDPSFNNIIFSIYNYNKWNNAIPNFRGLNSFLQLNESIPQQKITFISTTTTPAPFKPLPLTIESPIILSTPKSNLPLPNIIDKFDQPKTKLVPTPTTKKIIKKIVKQKKKKNLSTTTPTIVAVPTNSNQVEQGEKVLKQVLSDIMEVKMEKIDNTIPLKDYGLDSLLATEFSNTIQNKLNVFIPSLTLLDRKTNINHIVKNILSKSGSPTSLESKQQQPEEEEEYEEIEVEEEIIVEEEEEEEIKTTIHKILNKKQQQKSIDQDIIITKPNNNYDQSPSHQPSSSSSSNNNSTIIMESEMATVVIGIEPIGAPYLKQQKDIMKLFEPSVPEKEFLRNVYSNCKIRQRHYWFDMKDLSMIDAKTSERNLMFTKLVKDTVLQAAERVITNAGIDRSLITHVVGVTSTGMLAPSIDAILVRELGLSDTTGRTMINFMGCGAAIIGLRTSWVHARARPGKYVLLVCVEASSINMEVDLASRGDLVSNCIFSDGAVATLISTQPRSQLGGKGYVEMVDDISYLMEDSLDALHMHFGDKGINLTLRPQLSMCIARNIKPTITDFLAKSNLTVQDIHFWAVHPGGRRILEAVHEGLDLAQEELADSYDVMKWYGNMVSCSALYVLKRVMNRILLMKQEGSSGMDHGMVMAFSPGASIEAILLKLIK
ncbi:putative polyketide synthase [Cavenderia fasciculata]|uniref:Polyketide synthase n=1 Tax=Cavenderia fasciculata TaxID=261658 RepID=F4Q869_CACFS|nr:putative polyketide synthase [Cavenderia fasciculata]EGG15969.1 putative polyketide synthase [Cavenderia fasciculata]|eukprot:XP_004352294.1 putative polyketide synthase [Cavenderia fasciculata]